jgi:RNA polymerase sigma-70 factor (ECF subfamily)
MSGRPLALEELLAQSSWLRRLARRLVAGEDAAEDLVQETWLAALRHPPADGAARPWLARVARRLAANFRRGAARRRAHEAAAPGAESMLDPLAAAELLDLQRVLAEAVLRLPEPLRTTVVLRYVHGLDSQAIAQREGAPAGTVRWRLKRALELLRADLDQRSDGERERWLAALAPLLAERAPTAAAATAGAISQVVAGAGLALGGLLGLWLVYALVGNAERGPRASTGPARSELLARAEPRAALTQPAEAPDEPTLPARTADAAEREPTPRNGPPAPRRSAPVRGRLWIDGTEQPLDEVLTLRLRSGDLAVRETLVSAPDGSFESAAAFPRGIVLASVLQPSGEVASERETFFEPAAGEDWDLTVRWPTFVRFRVVDRAGTPLSAVRVTLAREGPEVEEIASETRKEGEVRLEGLSPGHYVLGLQRGFAQGERRVRVARGPNELGEIELGAAGSGEIRGELRSADGETSGTVLLLDREGSILARASTIHRGLPNAHEFVFADVPPGDYRLVPLAYDGRRYEPESVHVAPPETGIVFEARGPCPVLEMRWPEGLESGESYARVRGRWLMGAEGFARAEVERWLVLAQGHRPATGEPPEGGALVPRLEPGWGHAFLFVEAGADPDFVGGSGIAGRPLAGIEVRADGRRVATSDGSGLALVSLAAEPGSLAFHGPGWLAQSRNDGGGLTVVELRRD